AAGSTSKVKTLTIAGTTDAWTATLDLNNQAMVVDYTGASPLATIANQIKSAYANGTWTNPGITSAAAAAVAVDGSNPHKTGLGFAESGTAFTSFVGQPVDSTAVLVRYTLYGDANLDGSVDTVDFNLLAASFSQTGKFWFNGDFNYDTTV